MPGSQPAPPRSPRFFKGSKRNVRLQSWVPPLSVAADRCMESVVRAWSGAGEGTSVALELIDIRRHPLEGANLSVSAGECVAIMGPSGAGKSVLLRAVADLDPNEGEALLDGRRRSAMSGPAWRRLVTYVAAEPGWWADIVGDHMRDRAAAVPLVEAMRLPAEALDWPVARLSTGERQRLGLVRALIQEPRALLLDEPTGALDAEAREAVERVLRERLVSGVAIILVTHDPHQAARLARRHLLMTAGHLSELAA